MTSSPELTDQLMNRLAMLKFFPTRPSVVTQISRMLNELCSTDSEATRLTEILNETFDEWPGPAKFREVFTKEIAAKRPKEEVATCPKCLPGLPGSSYRLTVIERLPNGAEVASDVPCSTHREFLDEERELSAKYSGSANHSVALGVGICDCPSGIRLRRLRARNGTL